jgi:hypothetical protein
MENDAKTVFRAGIIQPGIQDFKADRLTDIGCNQLTKKDGT